MFISSVAKSVDNGNVSSRLSACNINIDLQQLDKP